MTEKDNQWEACIDTGAKRGIRKGQRLWPRNITEKRCKEIPEQSETLETGSVYDQETWSIEGGSRYRIEARCPEVAA